MLSEIKASTKSYILYGSIYMKFLTKLNQQWKKSKRPLVSGRRMSSNWLDFGMKKLSRGCKCRMPFKSVSYTYSMYLSKLTKLYTWNLYISLSISYTSKAFLVAQTVKNLPAKKKARVWSLGHEDTLEKGMATDSSILSKRTLRE